MALSSKIKELGVLARLAGGRGSPHGTDVQLTGSTTNTLSFARHHYEDQCSINNY
jgi:hypothetical protein